MDSYILALDQGTTSSRAILFDRRGRIVASAQREFHQYFPRAGWVEHDPLQIWESQLLVAREAIKKAALGARQIASIGVTNQRETVVLWDKETGKPLYNAIVWQCRRSAGICDELNKKGYNKIIRKKTGLLLDPYFSGTKIKWLFDKMPALYKKAREGRLAFGTIDSWLIFNLTGRHLTDPSNASRTLFFNIHTGKWDQELLDIFGVNYQILPEVKSSSGSFGKTKKGLFGASIPIGGAIGDQQASLFGQGCFNAGEIKNTYGTGCFLLANTGKKAVPSKNKLLTTVAWDLGEGLEYALEGSVFIAGAVIKWLRDNQRIIKTAAESEKLAFSVFDTGGVYFVPAFVGLGAPYWDANARGAIMGITRGTTPAHIARAALEAIAFQSNDLIDALEEDLGYKIKSLKVDGGASVNAFLMQFQADLLGIPIETSRFPETTALGAAYMAGLNAGYWKDKRALAKNWRMGKKFLPHVKPRERKEMIRLWRKAVAAVRHF